MTVKCPLWELERFLIQVTLHRSPLQVNNNMFISPVNRQLKKFTRNIIIGLYSNQRYIFRALFHVTIKHKCSLSILSFTLDASLDYQHQRCLCKWKGWWTEIYSEPESVSLYIPEGAWSVGGKEGIYLLNTQILHTVLYTFPFALMRRIVKQNNLF